MNEKISIGPIVVMIQPRKVFINDVEIELNRREYDIFVCLAKALGAVLSRRELLSVVGREGAMLDRTIDSHLSHIRKKLRRRGIENVAIRSVYGIGYTLEAHG